MKRKVTSIIVCLTLVITALAIAPLNVGAATEEEIEQAIVEGIAWLVNQQDTTTGAWEDVPRTGFVLIKLQDRAYELEKDPFETDPLQPDYYVYAQNVIDGWEYLFSVDGSGNPIIAIKQTIGVQDHTLGASGTIDDPDFRVNGYGIFFGSGWFDSVYYTGICLMALAASRAPDRLNDGGIDYDGDGNVDTFGEIAQDVVDWLAFAQADVGTYEGGFYYEALDNACWSADNSNSGYAYLGLAAAEGFGCTVPGWVKTELNVYIDFIQNDQGVGDDGGEPTPDGGSGYVSASNWVNELKTGNLIFEMTFYGDNTNALRFQYAMDYIEGHWNDANLQPGFRGDMGIDDDGDTLIDEDPYDWWDNDGDTLIDEDPGLSNHYQAIYCLMKGLEYSGIPLLDLDGDNIPEHDWFEEFATILLDDQNPDGSWPSSPAFVWTDGSPGYMSGEILSTVWALLTLEKIAPPPPIEVTKDFRYTNVNFNPYHWVDPDGIPGTGDEYIVWDPAILGDLLPQDADGNYLVDVVVRGGKVRSTNPGQLYGVISITGPVDECTISDDFGMEFNVNPAHLGGGVEVIMVDPDGYATILTYDPGVSATVDNVANHVDISIDLAEPLEAGYTLMIYIKFETSMRGQTYPDPEVPYDEWFGNAVEILINDIVEPFTAEAMIKLSIK